MQNWRAPQGQRQVSASEPSTMSDGLAARHSRTVESPSLAFRSVVSEACPTEPISQDEVITKLIAVAPRDTET